MSTELLDKRISYYNKYIKDNQDLSIDIVREIYEIMKFDVDTPWKYNLPFIRKCSKYIFDHEKESCDLVISLYSLLSFDNLLELVDVEKKYDELDMYALNMLKAYHNTNSPIEKSIEIFDIYRKHTKKSILDDSYFFVYYNYVKNFSSKEDFQRVENDFYILLKHRKDTFIMMLPIRIYYMKITKIALSIIYIILNNKVNLYDLNRIIKYLKLYDDFFDKLDYVNLEENTDIFYKKRNIINEIDNYCINEIDRLDNIFVGVINRRQKSDFGFIIYGDKSIFTYLKKSKIKNGAKVLFAVFESYDKSKNLDSKQGIILKEMK